MEFLHALILGVVQGIAEFLPISSSGHLVIANALLRDFSDTQLPDETVVMGIALHFGTLLSILVVYRRELLKALGDRQQLLMIVLATIPVGLVGVLANDYVEEAFRSPLVAGVALIVTAGFLMLGHWLQKQEDGDTDVGLRSTIVIGLFQAVAIIPGISRSGSTIAAGMASGLTREHAARFSFLIAIPAIGGAVVVKLKDVVTGEHVLQGDPWALLLGTVVSFVVGVLALRWLIRLVVADRLYLFAAYCLIAGLLTVGWQLMK